MRGEFRAYFPHYFYYYDYIASFPCLLSGSVDTRPYSWHPHLQSQLQTLPGEGEAMIVTAKFPSIYLTSTVYLHLCLLLSTYISLSKF